MKTYFGSRWTVAVALVALLVPAAALLADTQDPQAPQGRVEESQPRQMPATCKEVMAQTEEMNAKMAAMDERLAALVAEMNATTGTAKSDVTAEVVAELVAQRRQMREMMDRQPMTMAPQMEQAAGVKEGTVRCMPGCPMMRAMGEAPKKRVKTPFPEHRSD